MIFNFFLRNSFVRYIKNFLKAYCACLKNKTLTFENNVSFSNTIFGRNIKIYANCEITSSTIGDFTYIARQSQVHNAKIGKFCSIGPNVKIGLGIHPSHTFVSTHPIFYSTQKQNGATFCNTNFFQEYKEISIGNDVWIGANALILDGVSIGNGCIIGAGAVITKDIPDYAICVGYSRIVRYRFSQDVIAYLNHIEWWNWDLERLKKHYKSFHSIQDFLGIN